MAVPVPVKRRTTVVYVRVSAEVAEAMRQQAADNGVFLWRVWERAARCWLAEHINPEEVLP